MNRQYFLNSLLMLMFISIMSTNANAHDIEVANANGVTIYYRWNYDNTELSVSYRGDSYDSYSDEYVGNIVIPEFVNYNGKTYNVTSIGDSAFSGCSGLASVKLGSNLNSIGNYAFAGSGLTSIEFLSGCNVGYYAFSGCNNLTAVYTPNIETWIENGFGTMTEYSNPLEMAHHLYVGGILLEELDLSGKYVYYSGNFRGCTDLKKAVLSEYSSNIDECAFYDCSSLVSITIPPSVKYVGELAFYNCRSLSEVHISDIEAWCNIWFSDRNVSMGGNAGWDVGCANPLIYGAKLFLNDVQVVNLDIPNTVTSINDWVFAGLSLNSITIPKSITSIGTGAFYKSSISRLNITDLEAWCKIDFKGIGDYQWHDWGEDKLFEYDNNYPKYMLTEKYLISISSNPGGNVFLNGEELKNLVVPNDIQSVPKYAFSGWHCLESVVVPEGITSIGDLAFYNCSNLNSISLPSTLETIEKGAFAGHSDYIKTTFPFPNKLKTIGAYAFCDQRFKNVVIPSSVESIGNNAYWGCYVEDYVYFPWENPQSVSWGDAYGGDEFHQNNTRPIICIPNGTRSLYQAWAPAWADYFVTGEDDTTSMQVNDLFRNDGIIYKVASLSPATVQVGNGNKSRAIRGGRTSCVIPAKVKAADGRSFAVTSIAPSAFFCCFELKSITIPSSVVNIDDDFFNCSLTSITLGHRNPATINNATCPFRNCIYTTLYVPKGSKAAYEAAGYRKEFKEIVEYTNIGDPTANTLSLSAIQGNRGKQVVLPIALNNQHQITGLQVDLYLPAGVTIAKKANGKMMVSTTDRMDGNYTLTGEAMDGFVRILGYSGDSDAFTATSGNILNITLDLSSEMNAGDYTIQLKDIVLSDVNNTEYHPANVEGKLTVKSYTLGDVDDSGAININDVVCIINHILNRSNGTFIPEAADVDENGTININDVVTLINRYILMRDNAPANTDAPRRASLAESNYLHLDNIAIKPGETKEITMLLSNSNEVRGIQGNIKLPAGLSFVNKSNGRPDVKNIDARSEDFTLSCAVQDDGSMTFAQYSADGFSYTGSEGGIFTFKIKAADSATAGSYAVDLKGVVLSIDGVGYDIPDRSSSVVVTGTDGISEIKTTEPVDVYTLDGRKIRSKASDMSELPNGVYIVNGKKIVVK